MSAPPPIGAGNPAFLAVFHLPGVALAQPIMEVVPDISLQRILWVDWLMIENSDDAERLHGVFQKAEHVFLCVNAPDYSGGEEGAEQAREVVRTELIDLVTALRLHKSGPVVDPRFSQQYLRVRSLNRRIPGPYGARLLECPPHPRYHIDASDLAGLATVYRYLKCAGQAPDPSIVLALRNFGFSYGYGLTVPQRLAYLFAALEAVYGEYRKQNRPTPRVTLGAAASMASREANAAEMQAFLDGAQAARGMRNAVAHGNVSYAITANDPFVVRLEECVRDGLRALIAFAAHRSALQPPLELIESGMGSLPPKSAYQKLLSHAAKGQPAAKAMIAALLASYP